jgi:hypothetical protein
VGYTLGLVDAVEPYVEEPKPKAAKKNTYRRQDLQAETVTPPE